MASSDPPEMMPIGRSSHVEAVGHDGTALWVRFRGTGLYHYRTAGQEHHKALVNPSSAGAYVHAYLRHSHRGERVT
jgi:hypothetical protein